MTKQEEYANELLSIINDVNEMPNKQYEIEKLLENINVNGTKKYKEKISDEISDLIDGFQTDLEDWFVELEDIRRKLLGLDEDDE